MTRHTCRNVNAIVYADIDLWLEFMTWLSHFADMGCRVLTPNLFLT
jgi:hypothetical protein